MRDNLSWKTFVVDRALHSSEARGRARTHTYIHIERKYIIIHTKKKNGDHINDRQDTTK